MAEILKQTDGIIDFDISINGTKIKDTIEVQEIEIDMEVNRISSAVIVLKDGGAIGAVNTPFSNSEGSDFIPGSEIEIALGYIDNTLPVFKGIIVSQQLRVKSSNSQLIVQCKDKAINMTKGRFNAIFQNKKDSDAISAITGKYSLELDLDQTTIQHPIMMQYNCSDWDFTVIRAEANNMLVKTYQNKLSVKKVDFSADPTVEIKASQIVKDIDLKLESEQPAGSYIMTSWDPENQENISEDVAISDGLNQGNLGADKLSGTLSNKTNMYSSAFLNKDELNLWGTAMVSRAVLDKIQGKITVPGTTKIIAGDIVKLSEFSERFNGNTFISRVVHSLQDGEWLTYLHVGKPVSLHASLTDIEAPGASGLLPSLRGLQIAKVKKIVEDPDNSFRVLVSLPTMIGDGQDDGIWARMSFPYASNSAGFFFFPEIDDEVIVSFINNDPRFPVITGALYSSKNSPIETPDDQNQFKSIYTKSGISIRFDDTDKILTIQTPSENTIVLDDKNKKMSMTDMNNNSIEMDSSGISIKSPKDITLSADGNINIKATSNLELKATGDAKLDGMSITQSAQTSFTAKGNASAELSASGQTTVKGAMVMIN